MVLIGKIVKVRSNKGEVVVTSPPGSPGLHALQKGDCLVLKSQKYEKQFQVETAREIKGSLAVKFKGIDSINDAFRLIGYSIHHPGETDANDDSLNVADFTVRDIQGKVWGAVTDIDTATLNKLLEVRGDNATYYVPFTDAIVKEIDKENRRILIDPPEGLMELNET